MSATDFDLPTQVLEALRTDLSVLRGMQCGIEKESLRVTEEGELSPLPHPIGLGSALTHPHITTDFSEAQLELITSVHDSSEACLTQLEDVHRFVYQQLHNELLWASSMPCVLGKDAAIPVGQYGSSNIGRAKTVYRLGLGNRYGRLMQTISGIHYNFSVPDSFWEFLGRLRGVEPDQNFRTAAYFELIRNFRRYSWLLIYLFGASPAICKSFVKTKTHSLEVFDEGSLYLPFATSLRMGGLGYQSDAQRSLHISYNCLARYTASMEQALTTSYPPYEAIGVKVDGEYRQLNTSLLQIENEFYGTIRPTRPVAAGERPLSALRDRGVEYVEVRCLDLNPFLPAGIDSQQVRFLDQFLLYCLLLESPEDSEAESAQLTRNQLDVVERGRETNLPLTILGTTRTLTECGAVITASLEPIAALLDSANGNDLFTYTLAVQKQKLIDPEHTPSARVIDMMRRQQIPYFRFIMNQSIAHKGYFEERPLRDRTLKRYTRMARESMREQARIEQTDDTDFETFLEDYLAFR